MKILINQNKVKVADLNVNPVGVIPQKVLLRGVRLNYKTDEEGKRVSNEVVYVRYDVMNPSTLGTFVVRVDTSQIIDYLHDYQAKKPWYIPAYALELQIYMGCRRGELPPIKWTSVNEDGISIETEQLTVKKTETEKEHFVIVPHTKTYKDRVFPRTEAIDDLLNRLKKVHDVYYSNSEYLFPANSENGVITNNTVYDFYRRMLKKLGIKQEKRYY